MNSASIVTKVKPVVLHLPPLHKKQSELVHAFEALGVRFIVGACGTKFGKTFGCSIRLVKEAWENKGSLNWWVAPTFSQSKMAYDTVRSMLPTGTYTEYKADLRLVILEPDGTPHSKIEFKSGDNPDSLRGYAVNFFVLDEAARMSYDSFISVMTTVTQTGGRGIIISTPKGRGWFYDVYNWGEKYDERGKPKFGELNPDIHKEWFSLRMPTWSNPFVDPDFIRDSKRTLPKDVFQQEYAAKFISDSAGVFRNVSGCIKGTQFEPPKPGYRYVMGVDLARLRDFTVITVVDQIRNHLVYLERFNQVQWQAQYFRIISLAKQYKAEVCIDSTGIGDPIVEAIVGGGVKVTPYKIGGSLAKQKLIDKLRVNIENNKISYPENKFTLPMLEELRSYESTFTDNGIVRYSAPSGKKDDCVISLALANWISDVEPFVYRAWTQSGI